ncbi:putative ekda protein [Botrytis fragariae]|uniref:Putative ekda protein n=1 Tax=Botrytis fragariae TaxID=1964551 RepID=A0A8H6ANE5_9HELO|nr:putative ekda protein [Botrytis fragariae]KAF5870672.1 putative ekda protein [Botrytis fragariae]
MLKRHITIFPTHRLTHPELYKRQNPSDQIQFSKLKLKPSSNKHHSTNPPQLPLLVINFRSSQPISNESSSTTSKKMGANTITITNNSTADVYVSVTYDGNDFQKGGSEVWYPLTANGGTDTWNYRAENQIARVARSKTAGTVIESFLAVPGKTIYIY